MTLPMQVALFLTAPGTLDPSLALGLYVKCGASDWLYRGAVHTGHPSEVMPLQVKAVGCAAGQLQAARTSRCHRVCGACLVVEALPYAPWWL